MPRYIVDNGEILCEICNGEIYGKIVGMAKTTTVFLSPHNVISVYTSDCICWLTLEAQFVGMFYLGELRRSWTLIDWSQNNAIDFVWVRV